MKKENKFYRGIKKFFSGLAKRIFKVRIVNPHNEPLDKNFVVCCNHTSLMDVIVIASSLKNQVCFMAKKEVFKVPVLKSFARAMGAFPVDRKNGDVGAIKKTIEILKDGSCVGIFPQGTRCPYENPRQTPIKDGIGMVAQRAGVGILPVAIRTRAGKLKLFKQTEFVVGKMIYPEELSLEGTHKEQHTQITRLAFDRVCDMLEKPMATKNTKILKSKEEK